MTSFLKLLLATLWVLLSAYLAQRLLPQLGLLPATWTGGTPRIMPWPQFFQVLLLLLPLVFAGQVWMRLNSGYLIDTPQRAAREIQLLLLLWPIAILMRFFTVDFPVSPIQVVIEMLLGISYPVYFLLFIDGMGRQSKLALLFQMPFVWLRSFSTPIGGLVLLFVFMMATTGYLYKRSSVVGNFVTRIQDELIGRNPATASASGGNEPVIRMPIVPADARPGVILVDGVPADDLQDAFNRVQPGGSIHLSAGFYRQAGLLRQSGVTITGAKGAVIYGAQTRGKGAIVISANDTVIEGIECHSIKVADGNGVCVRLQGTNLTLRNVYFHHAQGGLLGPRPSDGGRVLIEDSRFEYMGMGNFFHGIYTLDNSELIIRDSYFLATSNGGHEIKSRSTLTEITGTTIASLESRDSRLVDAPNGGDLIMRDNIMIEGVRSENSQLIGWGHEGVKYDHGRIALSGNLIISDKGRSVTMLGLPRLNKKPDILVAGNVFVGAFDDRIDDTNRQFATRKDAGLPAAPALPPKQQR